MKTKYRFVFEDNGEVVGLDRGRSFGPWDSKEEAMDALRAEFFCPDPWYMCYRLEECQEYESVDLANLFSQFADADSIPIGPYLAAVNEIDRLKRQIFPVSSDTYFHTIMKTLTVYYLKQYNEEMEVERYPEMYR